MNCPTPSKTKYTEIGINLRLPVLQQHAGKRLRTYGCVCGYWHLASNPGRKKSRQRRQRNRNLILKEETEKSKKRNRGSGKRKKRIFKAASIDVWENEGGALNGT